MRITWNSSLKMKNAKSQKSWWKIEIDENLIPRPGWVQANFPFYCYCLPLKSIDLNSSEVGMGGVGRGVHDKTEGSSTNDVIFCKKKQITKKEKVGVRKRRISNLTIPAWRSLWIPSQIKSILLIQPTIGLHNKS